MQQNLNKAYQPIAGLNQQSSAQAYDELKKRLLNEYKKMANSKKSFDDSVREKYKNLKQRTASGKKSASQHQMNSSVTNNLGGGSAS